jgi:hypothetical protein
MPTNKHDFSTAEREKLAKEGKAMKSGAFPVRNKQDLKDAVQSIGRASNRAAAKNHVKKRARALGATDALPEKWKD